MRLKYLLILAISIIAISFVGCKDDDVEPKKDDPDPVVDFTIPTYADDYSAISSWTNRSSWNLANVHDPSVAYYKGYYYMYGTDASYGNAHEGHGHFQGKRSTDLVNWSWLGGPFYDPPTWVADSLNAISDEIIPTKMPAMIPCRVVPFQKSIVARAGIFADAATLNAQPTKKLTFIFSNKIPSTIAIRPTTTEPIRPKRTFV